MKKLYFYIFFLILLQWAVALPQNSPVVVNPIPDLVLELVVVDTSVTGVALVAFDLNHVFADPDGDSLSYSAESSNRVVFVIIQQEAQLIISAADSGEATITVRAEDTTAREASDKFNVTVVLASPRNQRPIVVDTIPDTNLTAGGIPFMRNLEKSPVVFFDPEDDSLSYSAISSDESVAEATIENKTLTIMPLMVGNIAVTVRALDDIDRESNFLFAGTPTEFRVEVTPEQELEISLQTTSEAILAGEDTTLVVFLEHNQPLDTVSLFVRRGGDTGFSTGITHPGVFNTGRIALPLTIPNTLATLRGLEIFAETRINDLDSLTASASIRVFTPNLPKETPQPAGIYQLFSTPLELSNSSASEVLEDDLGPYDITKWRFFDLLPNQQYKEFPNDTNGSPIFMTPGKSYWLHVRDSVKSIDTGLGTSFSTLVEFEIALNPAWNFVSNPFYFAIPQSNFRLVSNPSLDLDIRFFNGQDFLDFPDSESLRPFDGYALFVDKVDGDTLIIDPDLSASPPPTSGQKTIANYSELGDQWSIRILAESRDARDTQTYAAVVRDASHDWDRMDRPEAPVIGEYVSVYFPHSEWNKAASKYTTDTRPEPIDGDIWEFEVKTNIRDEVKLTFAEIESVPEDFGVWLVDEVLNLTQNLRERDQFSVAGVGEEHPRRLKLVVGKADFVEGNITELQNIPTNFELSQNFPNPFNPATTIRYSLPNAEKVSLKVYNLLGKEVATLLQNEEKAAGHHFAIWDGRNQNRQHVSSGLYFYRLQAGKVTIIKKMALVK